MLRGAWLSRSGSRTFWLSDELENHSIRGSIAGKKVLPAFELHSRTCLSVRTLGIPTHIRFTSSGPPRDDRVFRSRIKSRRTRKHSNKTDSGLDVGASQFLTDSGTPKPKLRPSM